MFKILMLNPPYYPKYSRSQRSPGVIKSGVIYYPIWLAYATGSLEQHGFSVKLVDAPAARLNLDTVVAMAQDYKPDLIVLETSTPSIYNDVAVGDALYHAVPGVIVALVGSHVTALPKESLEINANIQIIVRGEYDATLIDLAECLAGDRDLERVSGITYRTKKNEIVHTPDRPLIQNLDALPFVSEVYCRHLRVEDYFYSITQYPEVAILTGRGCPYQCSYCVWPQTLAGRGYRKRSVENVADEFEFITRELPQVREVFIEDDTLTVDKKRSQALAQELIRRGNRLKFSANSRADVDETTLRSLKAAGLRLLCVGFESGDQTILDNIHKNIRLDQFVQFRNAAKNAGIFVHGCFMAGNPGETHETLEKTRKMALQLNPDTAQFFPVMAYPGTDLYHWADSKGYLEAEDFSSWLDEDGMHRSVISTPDLTSEELVEWCEQSRRAYYLRLSYILNVLVKILQHPTEIRRMIRAFQSFWRYLVFPTGKRKNEQQP